VTDAAARHDRYQAGIRDHLLLHFGRHANLRHGGEVLVADRAEGVYVWDTRGRRYIDGLSCLFCAQLGYGAEFASVATGSSSGCRSTRRGIPRTRP
jgi:adenosylmethionine-8-amino-7-oxononanoate aminotransferase